MVERYAHLVGSLPGDSAYEAMSTAMRILGPRLRSLPDGETGERRNWIISIIESLRSHPDLILAKAGDWSDYNRTPSMRVRRGRTLYGTNLDFGTLPPHASPIPCSKRSRKSSNARIWSSSPVCRAILI